MTDNDYKKSKFNKLFTKESVQDVPMVSPEEVVYSPVPVKAKSHFEARLWKELTPIFRCLQCSTDRDSVDDIILHILLHYKKDEHEEVLEQLLKEKECQIPLQL